MKKSLTIALFFLVITSFSQQIPQKYFVAFSDKNGTPYTIGNPLAFLTQRAIDRRNAQGIAITEEDLPVNPAYVTGVAAIGVQVYTRSKWFNGVTIRVVDSSSVLNSIRALPFVLSVTRVTDYLSKKSQISENKFRKEEILGEARGNHDFKTPSSPQTFDYGPSYNQIHMLNGDALHNMGYRGQGKVIAILDAGFDGADINPVFDSLRASNLILGTRDFVEPFSNNIYTAHPHGAEVFSLIGGDTPGELIGTAPRASFWLIRTEDAPTENIVEEYNWVVGAEMADSVGADIITSSLGYTQFDGNWMNHTWADMNGTTNPSTRGANIAASKGMACSIAAGNDGGNAWRYISSPSDALDALCLAAVDASGFQAGFSSHGFINGSFVKPNIATQGQDDYFCVPDGTFEYGSGTSFATPVNSGMMACLWQARPNLTQAQLRLAIEKCASQYTHPDTLLGYGIPDYLEGLTTAGVGVQTKTSFRAYPNPFKNFVNISFDNNISGSVELTIVSITGDVVLTTRRTILPGEGNILTINDLGKLVPGMYILKITSGNATEYLHLVRIEK